MDKLDEASIIQLLNGFRCKKDEDIELFLQNKAIEFERLSKSRTYLVCDVNDLENKSIDELIIYGYISLALKVLTVPDKVFPSISEFLESCPIK